MNTLQLRVDFEKQEVSYSVRDVDYVFQWGPIQTLNNTMAYAVNQYSQLMNREVVGYMALLDNQPMSREVFRTKKELQEHYQVFIVSPRFKIVEVFKKCMNTN